MVPLRAKAKLYTAKVRYASTRASTEKMGYIRNKTQGTGYGRTAGIHDLRSGMVAEGKGSGASDMEGNPILDGTYPHPSHSSRSGAYNGLGSSVQFRPARGIMMKS